MRIPLMMSMLTALLLLANSLAIAATPDDDVFRAMQDELDRSISELKLGSLEAPYFISYSVWDIANSNAAATLGALKSSQESSRRILSVQVRVGDYSLDNTNFMGSGFQGYSGMAFLPLENDYTELRRQIWLATDAAFKEALENYSQKTAALQNRVRDEELPDFSKEAPFQIDDSRPAVRWNQSGADALVRELSALFLEQPEIQSSLAEMSATTVTTRYVNSEGSRFIRTSPTIGLVVKAYGQAADGRPVDDAFVAFARRSEDLPARSDLNKGVEALIERIRATQQAPLLKRYNGPVLFSGQAAAELFAQRFAPALVAIRTPVGENSQNFSVSPDAGTRWEDRIGGRVLPRFMAVVDDPTVDTVQGQALVSSYRVDDEAVAAGPTVLIENGRLKRLLAGRTPVTGIEQSTGNARAGAVIPSTIIATAKNGMPADELIDELLLLVEEASQEFGILVTRIASPGIGSARDTQPGSFMQFGVGQGPVMAQEAFRIYPDGRRERIRSLELSGVSASAFRDIIAVSDKPNIHNAPWSVLSGISPGMIVSAAGISTLPLSSWVVPDLLFEELSVRKPDGENPTLPIVSRPN